MRVLGLTFIYKLNLRAFKPRTCLANEYVKLFTIRMVLPLSLLLWRRLFDVFALETRTILCALNKYFRF